MLRKKKSTFDESDLPTDNWIWGNNRGGGGAPLRDHEGNEVANLRKVLTGVVAVDHSPSPTGKFKGTSNARSGYFEEPVDNRRREGRDGSINRASQNNQRGRNNNGYDSEEGDYNDRRRGGDVRNRDYDEPRHRDQDEPPNRRPKRQSAYRDQDDQERIIPGLNDRPVNLNDPNSPRIAHVHNNYGANSPPKKFMGALKEMVTGGDNRELELKHKKQLEYQEMLKQQIEEKKRKKEQEQREQEAIKRREYEEYMAQHNRGGAAATSGSATGPVGAHPNRNLNSSMDPDYARHGAGAGSGAGGQPPRHPHSHKDKFAPDPDLPRGGGGGGGGAGGGRQRGASADYSDAEDGDRRGGGGGVGGGRRGVPAMQLPNIHGNRGGGGGGGADDSDREYGNDRRRGGGRGGGGGGRGYDSGADDRSYRSDDDYSAHSGDSGGGRGGGRRGGGEGGRRGKGGGTKSGYVPEAEYDELSKLCDRLLTQQEQLQEEVRKQAEMLKALKNGPRSVGAPTRAGAAALGVSPSKLIHRSKSAINPSRGKEASSEAPVGRQAAGRAASHLRSRSEKEAAAAAAEKERLRAEKEYLKSFEPIKHKPQLKGGKQVRPSSMHALGGAKGAAAEDPPRKPVPKVAFGSNRDLDKYSHGGPSKLAQQGASVMGAAGSNRGGDTRDKGLGQPKPSRSDPHRGGNDRNRERDDVSGGGGGGGGGLNGFAKLQLSNSRVSAGPVVVVHDEEPVGRRGGGDGRMVSPVRGKGQQSLELRGNSEYIPISDNADVIGGDQLEKLLLKSKQVRY